MKKVFVYFILVLSVFVAAPAFVPAISFAQSTDKVEDLDAKQKELLKKEQEILQALKEQAKTKSSAKPVPAVQTPSAPTAAPAAKKTTAPKPTATTAASTTTPEPAKPVVCDDQLKKSNELITRLRKELDETRSRLAISETEVERLAYLLDDTNKGGKKNPSNARKPAGNEGLRVREPGEIQPKVDQDMSIATVTAEKAQLRTGPGMNNSPLMTVAKGTRLAIETRSGQWYRVIAPSGARAWVSAEVIDFGGGARIKNEPSFARNPGLNEAPIDAAEAAAFEAIIKGTKKP